MRVVLILLFFGLVTSQTFTQYYFKNITESTGPFNDDYVSGVELDSQSNTYIGGKTEGGLFTANGTGYTDIIVAKYNAIPNNGTLNRIWARQISSELQDVAFGVVLSPSEDYLYVYGTFQNSPWLGVLSTSTGDTIANFSYTNFTNISSFIPLFSDVAATSSSLYIVGYYPIDSYPTYNGLALKLDATTLAVDWSFTASATVYTAVAFQTTTSRLFFAGYKSLPGVGREFYLSEIDPLNGINVTERIWPGTTCGSRENYITDIVVGSSYLYFLGSSNQEFLADGTPSTVCDFSSAIAVVGSLPLSNLYNVQWMYNLSALADGGLVEGSSIDLGSDGLLYFVGDSDAAELLGQPNTAFAIGGGYFDWYMAVLNSTTGTIVDFMFQGSSSYNVDDKAPAIKTQTSNGILTIGYNTGGSTYDLTVCQARNYIDPSPIPSSTPPASTTPRPTSSTSTTPNAKPNTTPIIVGIVVGSAAVIAVAAAFIIFILRNKQKSESANHSDVPLKPGANSNYWSPATDNYSPMGAAEDNTYSPIRATQAFAELQNMKSSSGFLEIKYSELSFGTKLGQGAFGIVYKGKWRGGDVAIKQVHENVTEDQVTDFMKEAALMQKIRPHSNVVQFLGLCSSPLVIVTEFLEGGSLYQFLRTEEGMNMGRNKERDLMKGIASGMYHLASEGIVHRDLAARNILLSGTLVPKISDFGMSRLVANENGSVTQSVVGPLKWMAPENVFDRTYSEKSDVWSYGILCIEVITKQDPYPGMDGLQVASRIGSKQSKPDIPTTCDEDVQNMLRACFEFTPNDRPDFKTIFEELLK